MCSSALSLVGAIIRMTEAMIRLFRDLSSTRTNPPLISPAGQRFAPKEAFRTLSRYRADSIGGSQDAAAWRFARNSRDASRFVPLSVSDDLMKEVMYRRARYALPNDMFATCARYLLSVAICRSGRSESDGFRCRLGLFP